MFKRVNEFVNNIKFFSFKVIKYVNEEKILRISFAVVQCVDFQLLLHVINVPCVWKSKI